MPDFSTVQLQRCLDRLNAGEAQGRADLLSCACDRLERLTRKMLKDYRGVKRWEETGDVLQNALLRLHRALQQIQPPTLRDFFRLAALQVRRELLDLARHYQGPQGQGAHHISQPQHAPGVSGPAAPLHDPADLTTEPSRLALWTEFHRHVDQLPEEEREVFDLLWYQGLTQIEAAQVLGVSDRTVKSRWRAARLRLHEALGGQLPEE
jgi:RNA polymerase sigma-70 factor (ECF subfamily)